MARLVIYYDKHGKAVSDFELEEELVYGVLRASKELNPNFSGIDPKRELYYSTFNIIHRIKLAVVQGKIDADDIVFLYDDEKLGTQYIPVNEYGATPYTPDGFTDPANKLCEEILTRATKKKKEERLHKKGEK
jgi:hypothetical protein